MLAGALSELEGFSPVTADRTLHIGSRNLDTDEQEQLAAAGVDVIPGGETDASAKGRLARSLEALRVTCDEVHLHLDMDAHDADFGRANDWATSGGLDAIETCVRSSSCSSAAT